MGLLQFGVSEIEVDQAGLIQALEAGRVQLARPAYKCLEIDRRIRCNPNVFWRLD